jgi:iron(III) transport system substrate-binding protein
MQCFIPRYTTTILAAAAVFGFAFSGVAALAADGASALEKRFAELAKLPAAERTKALIEGAKKEGKLRMLPIMRSKRGRKHTALFTKQYGFVKAEIFDLSSEGMAEKFVIEESAGRHLSDLISISVTDMGEIVRKKLTARFKTPMTDRILPAYNGFKSPDNLWVPAYWKEHGISYNTKLMSEAKAPKNYFDLCKPEYKGKVSYETSHNSWLLGIYQVFGKDMKKIDELFTCIGKNQPILQQGHTSRLTLMLAGDHAINGENALYRGTQQNLKNPKKAPFKAVYTAEVIAYPSVMSINKNAANPMAAALYVDWVLSKKSQAYIAKQFRGPITVDHPYMPANAMIVPAWYVDKATNEKMLNLWKTRVGRKR